MVLISPGTFRMGSDKPKGPPHFGSRDEKPVRSVTLSYSFWMGATEVTQAQYRALMGTSSSSALSAHHPVCEVSWNEARAYCTALTQQQSVQGKLPVGCEYRLPTEAEWEYACRAGTTTQFHVGAELSCSQARIGAVYHPDWEPPGDFEDCRSNRGAAPVGSYPANPWGLYDMHGNVMEWCLDSYSPYTAGAVVDPFVTGGPDRVVRGGSWFNNSTHCHSARRFNGTPGLLDIRIGFRVVLGPVRAP
ncbi:MAG: formylglycine-generating enzyme family protein [Planctomycetia bacterium]